VFGIQKPIGKLESLPYTQLQTDLETTKRPHNRRALALAEGGTMNEARSTAMKQRPQRGAALESSDFCPNLDGAAQAPQAAPPEPKPAQALWLSALQLAETAESHNPLRLAQFLDQLAKLYEAHGEEAKAAQLYEQLACVLEQVAPQPEVQRWHLHVWWRLAGLQQAQGRVAEAEQWVRYALTLAESIFGKCSQEAARVQQRLAALLQEQQQLDEAYKHYERALVINESLFGEESGLVTELCRELSQLEAARGHRAEAKYFAHRAGAA
jgi:tetratricopeptide (TPR) repeat protein